MPRASEREWTATSPLSNHAAAPVAPSTSTSSSISWTGVAHKLPHTAAVKVQIAIKPSSSSWQGALLYTTSCTRGIRQRVLQIVQPVAPLPLPVLSSCATMSSRKRRRRVRGSGCTEHDTQDPNSYREAALERHLVHGYQINNQ